MRKTVAFLIILLPFCLLSSKAQGTYQNYSDFFLKVQQPENGKGEVRIIQDQRINTLVSDHIAAASRVDGIPGYRIRIYSNSGQAARQEANQAKTLLFQNYPSVPVYLDFQNPNYKLYVGDYRTKSEAQKNLNEIKKTFGSAFIVSTLIKVPELE